MRSARQLPTVIWIIFLAVVLTSCSGQTDETTGSEPTGDVAVEPATEAEPEGSPAEPGAASAGEPGEVTGPDVTLTLGHPFPASHPIQVGVLEPFVEQVSSATNGSVTIEIVPGGALGPAPGTYENVVAGAQDIGWALQGYTPGRFPLTEVIEMPYTFSSASQATDVLWTLYEEFPELQEEYADVHVLGLWTHDVGDLWTAETPVATVDDMAGLTIRAPGPMQNELISALGGSPVGLPAPELFDSLERGVIDGLMIANSGLESFGLFEVLSSGTQCNCYVAAQFLTLEQSDWDALSPSQQSAIDAIAGRTLSLQAAGTYDEEYQAVADRVAEEGIEVTVLEGEALDGFLAAGDDVVTQWIEAREAEGAPGQAMHDRLLELAG